MKTNSLKLKDSKTEVIVLGSAQQLMKTKLHALRVGDCLVRVTRSVRNLGVQFVAEMTMESSRMWLLCASQQYSTSATPRGSDGIWQRQSKSYSHLLQADSMLALHCYIDCLWPARLIDGAMKYSHATPLLMKLPWLPIAVRVEFKILRYSLIEHWLAMRMDTLNNV